MPTKSAPEVEVSTKQASSRAEQDRSRRTKAAIVDAAIRLIATGGVGSVTHRAVAREGSVSIANTTYHFESKGDIVRRAYEQIVDQNASFLTTTLSALTERKHISPDELTEFLTFISVRQMTERRDSMIAWLELMLEAARHTELQTLTNQWYDASSSYWKSLVARTDAADADAAGLFLLCFLIGKYFYLTAQGAPTSELLKLRASFDFLTKAIHGQSLGTSTAPTESEEADTEGLHSGQDVGGPLKQKRSEATRNQILDAAVKLISRGGPSALKMREIAAAADVSLAATTYHFSSRQDLINQTYERIYRIEFEDYQLWSKSFLDEPISKHRLVDSVTAYFFEEVSGSRERALGNRELLLETARHEKLRPYAVEICRARRRFWGRMLVELDAANPWTGADVVLSALAGRFILMLGVGGRFLDPEQCRADVADFIDFVCPGPSRTDAQYADN